MTEKTRVAPPVLAWASLSDVGRVRPANEDFVGDPDRLAPLVGGPARLASRGALFAVADGMGGHARGEIASRLAIEVLYSTFYNSPGDSVEMFKKAILTANTAVRRAGVLAKPEKVGDGHEARTLPRMGTTLVAALVLGRWVLVGNIGDSRAYLMEDGRLEQVSRDHTYLAEEIRRGLVSPEASEAVAFKHLITRSLGTKDEVEVDLFWRPWPDGATLLLATDGLHGVVEELEMETILASRPPEQAVAALVKAAHDGGAPDNVSVVVVHKTPARGKTRPLVRLFAGTSGFSYDGWTGTFYPEDLPADKRLAFYATQLPGGRDQQHVLPDAEAGAARGLGRAGAGGLSLRAQGLAAHHAHQAPQGGRRRGEVPPRLRAPARGQARACPLRAAPEPQEGRPAPRGVPRAPPVPTRRPRSSSATRPGWTRRSTRS